MDWEVLKVSLGMRLWVGGWKTLTLSINKKLDQLSHVEEKPRDASYRSKMFLLIKATESCSVATQSYVTDVECTNCKMFEYILVLGFLVCCFLC